MPLQDDPHKTNRQRRHKMPEFGLEFSMTTWGSPDAPKRALLLHGLQGVGQVFFKVAKILVANGEQ